MAWREVGSCALHQTAMQQYNQGAWPHAARCHMAGVCVVQRVWVAPAIVCHCQRAYAAAVPSVDALDSTTVAGDSGPPLVVASAAAPMMLQAVGLSKIYGSGSAQVVALDNVSFSVRRGEFVVMLGPSGSGKSTLLNILGGLDTPTRGTLAFGAHDLTHANDDALTRYRRDHVGFVFQFYNLIPSLTARENVELVTEIARSPMSATEALAQVGLAERVDHFPSQLSGGEQQRVAIARAIAKRPDMLLCDEPTGALDSATGRLVLEAIDDINRRTGTTVVIITHNIVIAEMADRVVRLADGRIVSEQLNGSRKAIAELSW